MGKIISKIVFMPPPYYSQPDDEYKFLNTSHNSKIQFRFINRNAKFNILISHGNAEDIVSVSDWASNKFSKYVDVNIILYEYTGYGENEENLSPSEQYVYNDIECVYKYVTQELNIKPENIILYGRSLGSGPSCFIAEKYPVGGFTMPGDMFPNIDRMKNIECPVLILHSIKDDIVPFYHAKELFRAAKNPYKPLFVDGTDHNNIDKISDEVFNHINEFIMFLDKKYNNVQGLNSI